MVMKRQPQNLLSRLPGTLLMMANDFCGLRIHCPSSAEQVDMRTALLAGSTASLLFLWSVLSERTDINLYL
jgi:hypothetical protein